MEAFITVFILALLGLLLILLVRTFSLTSRQVAEQPPLDLSIDVQAAAQRLASALRFQTISYQDPAQFDSSAFLGLHRYLESAFPCVHAHLDKEVIGDYSLLYTWKGRSDELKPVLLMGHIDVVPVEAGAEADWSYPPFSGTIAEGFIWGRGAMDDKLAVLGLLEAGEALLTRGFQPLRTVYLAFGHDEEISGVKGAAQIANLLHSRGIELEYVLDEGLAIIHNVLPLLPKPIALIGLAEKGYLSLELTADCPGGHSSTPPRATAIGALSAAIQRLERHSFPPRLDGPARQMLAFLAPEMPFPLRLVFSNLWLFGGLVKRQLSASPAANALLRTTIAPTIFEAGVKDNILPTRSRAVVNLRLLPGDSASAVIESVRRAVRDPHVKIAPLGSFVTEPSSVSAVDSPAFQTLSHAVRRVYPDAVVAPGLVLGATDSRHYASLTANIYRFTPLVVGPSDLDRVHGTNERLSLQNYQQVIQFYAELIQG
jgi:carboxypeptidase PM20D1